MKRSRPRFLLPGMRTIPACTGVKTGSVLGGAVPPAAVHLLYNHQQHALHREHSVERGKGRVCNVMIYRQQSCYA